MKKPEVVKVVKKSSKKETTIKLQMSAQETNALEKLQLQESNLQLQHKLVMNDINGVFASFCKRVKKEPVDVINVLPNGVVEFKEK